VDNKVYLPKRRAESRDNSQVNILKPEKALTRTFSFGSLSIASIFKEQENHSLSLNNQLVFRSNGDEESSEEFSEDDFHDSSFSDQKLLDHN
jgi:hypothetical protein